MYEQDKTMQYTFYLGVIVFFIFAFCYFGSSGSDGERSDGVRARIGDSQTVNIKLQGTNKEIEDNIKGSIEQIGDAEKELDRAAASIERCESILEKAKRRTQEADEKSK